MVAENRWSYAYNGKGQRISKTYAKVLPGLERASTITPVNPVASLTSDTINYTYDHSGRLVGEERVEIFSDDTQEQTSIAYIYDDSGIIGMVKDGTSYYFHRNIQGDVVGVYNSAGTKVVGFTYDAYGNCTVSGDTSLANHCKIRYRGYYFDTETGLYWVQTRYYNPQWCRWISPDTLDYLDPESAHGLNLYAYCGNDPVNYFDPTGHFMISTAVIIGAIIGAVVGAGVGFGIAAYNDYKDDGRIFNGSVAWYDYLGAALLGAAVGAVVGGAIGYGVGYLAGGTYANGLVAKSVGSGVKSFLSQANKVHHVLGQTKHKLAGYTTKTMGKLMKKTLAKGVVSAYGKAQSAYWAIAGSEVTFVVIDGVIKISDMWIR